MIGRWPGLKARGWEKEARAMEGPRQKLLRYERVAGDQWAGVGTR